MVGTFSTLSNRIFGLLSVATLILPLGPGRFSSFYMAVCVMQNLLGLRFRIGKAHRYTRRSFQVGCFEQLRSHTVIRI